jgi:hypothetical protein
MRRYRLANTPPEKRKYLRKSQLWSSEFTVKLFCNVEFWLQWVQRIPMDAEGLGTAKPVVEFIKRAYQKA